MGRPGIAVASGRRWCPRLLEMDGLRLDRHEAEREQIRRADSVVCTWKGAVGMEIFQQFVLSLEEVQEPGGQILT